MEYRNYSNEIQIEIDDVYGCPGHCPGCVLSTIERKSNLPDMGFDTLVNSINKLKEYIPTLHNLEKINLTYGIADHFLMDNSYLEKTFNLGADLIQEANLKNKLNGVFYTASMIGKHEAIIDKVKFMQKVSKKRNVPFYIIAVLDPKNLYHKKFSDVYKKNIIETNKIIGRVDLSINLSEEAINFISPLELFEFAQDNNFDEVTINWTPTFDNLPFVYMDQNKLAKWLIEFDKLISQDEKLGTSYRPVMLRTINNLKCKQPELDYSFQENLEYNLKELIFKSIQIDEKGNIFPKYEAIGDIAHTPRLNIKEIGNINSSQSIQDMFEKNLNNTKKFITKMFVSDPCLDCKFNNYCANSGFHIYNHVLKSEAKNNININLKLQENIKNNGCLHIAKTMFEYYEKIAEDQDKLNES